MIKKIILIFCMLILISCDKKSSAPKEKILLIEPHTQSVSLFYSGIVQPAKTSVVISPVDGVVDEMNFHYGDRIKAGQLLFTLSSEKFQTDYKTALMQYLKAKNEFTIAQSQFTASQFLHKNQLISDDDFKGKESSFYNAKLALMQSEDALTLLLKQLALPGIHLDELTIQHLDKITQVMNGQGNVQKVYVFSPVTGVALFSMKNATGEEIKKIMKGDQIKQGDMLAVVGEDSGLMVHITVNEFNINQVKVGQTVKVTGPAFSDITLTGKIVGVDHQGQSSNGGVPLFPVDVIVPMLTPLQKSKIQIGMSAKVELILTEEHQLMVPLTAITQEQGQAFLEIQDKKTKQFKKIAVQTGETTFDSVVIKTNLHAGDRIRVSG